MRARYYREMPMIRQVWNDIPERRRVGFGRFRDAWCEARDCGAEPAIMRDALLMYYRSEAGRSKFARLPGRFISDEGWRESPRAWGDSNEPSSRESEESYIIGPGGKRIPLSEYLK